MQRIGVTEILLILLIVLLLFGGRKIPELLKGLGRGVKEFKDASKGEDKTTTDTKTTSEKDNTPVDRETTKE